MADQISTRFGPLGRCTALAAHLIISEVVDSGVIALTTIQLQLGSTRSTSLMNPPPPQSPSDRWHIFKHWLFDHLSDDGLYDTGPEKGWSMAPEEQVVVDKLLAAAGTFLMTEAATLQGQIDTWLVVEPSANPSVNEDIGFSRALRMRAGLNDVTTAGQSLLLRAGEPIGRADIVSETSLQVPWPVRVGLNPLGSTALHSVARRLIRRRVAAAVVPIPMAYGKTTLASSLSGMVVDETSSVDRCITGLELLADVVVGPRPRIPRTMRCAIVLDVCALDVVSSYVSLVRESILDRWEQFYSETPQVSTMFITAYGRRSDPVLLEVADLVRFSDASEAGLGGHLRTFAQSLTRHEPRSALDLEWSDHQPDQELDRIFDMAAALRSAEEMSYREILLVIDAASSHDEASIVVTPSEEAFDTPNLVEQLQHVDSLPDLNGHHVTIIAPSEYSRVFKALLAICTRTTTVDVRTLDRDVSLNENSKSHECGFSRKNPSPARIRRNGRRRLVRSRRAKKKPAASRATAKSEEDGPSTTQLRTGTPLVLAASIATGSTTLLIGATRSGGLAIAVAVTLLLSLSIASLLTVLPFRKKFIRSLWHSMLRSPEAREILVSTVEREVEARCSRPLDNDPQCSGRVGDNNVGLSFSSCPQ